MAKTDSCTSCGSDRVFELSGKTSDCFSATYKGKEYDGYVPSNVGIGGCGGDYIDIKLCMNCGKVQGEFPIAEEEVLKVFSGED